MKKQDLHALFIDELEDVLNAERQIVDALPRIISLAKAKDLKEGLTHHLKETKEQVLRIEKIFILLNVPTKDKACKAMEGLIKEADGIVKNKAKSAVLDAAIISAMQKIEHYEIASYGTLHNFAKQLELDSEIPKLLQHTLDEEGAADKLLTKIAKGTFFTTGVNEEAAHTAVSASGRTHRI